MKNYIKADLFRIFTRIPRWILIGFVLFIVGAVFWPGDNEDATIIQLMDMLEMTIKYAPVYLGFIEIIYIFGDDFAGKTAQIAIGTGVKRNEVILAKWLEVIIITAVDICMITLVAVVFCLIKCHNIPFNLLVDLLAHMLVGVLATAAFMALVFPIMFAMQNITLAFLVYIMIASGAINSLIGYLAGFKWVRVLRLDQFTLSNCLNVFRSRMVLGSFQWESMAGIILYIGITLGVTCFIYKSRELEF